MITSPKHNQVGTRGTPDALGPSGKHTAVLQRKEKPVSIIVLAVDNMQLSVIFENCLLAKPESGSEDTADHCGISFKMT